MSDCDQDIVAFEHLFLAGRNELAPAVLVNLPFHLVEAHPTQLPLVVQHELLRDEVVVDGNVFHLRFFDLPRGGLHFLEAASHDHIDLFTPEPTCGAAAIHRGVAASEHDHALADAVGVAECDA